MSTRSCRGTVAGQTLNLGDTGSQTGVAPTGPPRTRAGRPHDPALDRPPPGPAVSRHSLGGVRTLWTIGSRQHYAGRRALG